MDKPVSVWEDPRSPFRLEWAPEKLDRIRIEVVDAFYAVPRGGLEIGGVLLGRHEAKVLYIDDFLPMDCEHLTGPSFVLSSKDEAALEARLASAGDRAVGWFHSHTRSDIHLSDRDLDIQNRFFPKSSQIAVVLRPENGRMPRAKCFFRGPGGVMTSSLTTFSLDPFDAVHQGFAPTSSPPGSPSPAPVEIAPPAFAREPAPLPPRGYFWPGIGLALLALGAAVFFASEMWMPR